MTLSFIELRNKYQATFAKKAEDIQLAWNEKNIEQINQLIHKLSGSSGGYEFDDLCNLCQKTMKLIGNNEDIESAQFEVNIQQILDLLRN
jgi:hypothetical protein